MESYGVPIFIRYYYDFFDHILSLFVNNEISIFEESFLRQPTDTITITTCRPIKIMEITERVKLSTFLKIGCYLFRDMQMTPSYFVFSVGTPQFANCCCQPSDSLFIVVIAFLKTTNKNCDSFTN